MIEVEGDDLPGMHHRFAAALAQAWARIRAIQAAARGGDWDGTRPRWPMIVLRTPKGWTGPDVVDGVQVRGHVARPPGAAVRGPGEPGAPARCSSDWLRSYRPRSSSTPTARRPSWSRRANPTGDLRMSATPHANGGLLTRDLDLPDFRDYAVDVPRPGDGAGRVDPQARRDAARHLPRQPRPVPAVLPRRDQQQPARRGVRGVRPGLHGAGHRRTTWRSPATAG